MDEIHWEDPPAGVLFKHENRGGKYVDVALACRENPGKWAVLPREAATTKGSATGLAQGVRQGTTKGFKPKGAFEALWAAVEPEEEGAPETYKVYVRFVGDPSPADASDESGNGRSDGDGDGPPHAPFDPAEAGGGEAGGGEPPSPADVADIARAPRIRAWARENGWPDLPIRGRMPEGVLDAYEQAMARDSHG